MKQTAISRDAHLPAGVNLDHGITKGESLAADVNIEALRAQ
jgi:hypothetical protein